MFRVYKTRAVIEKVKAKQVTAENAQEMANDLMGRVLRDQSGVVGIEFPTLDGIKQAMLTDWVVRHENNTGEVMLTQDFVNKFEIGRNTSGN